MKQIFSVYDRKAEFYGPIFLFSAVGEALRAFQELVNDPQSTPGKYPDDFELYRLGYYDEGTGSLTHNPESLGRASQFRNIRETPIGLVKSDG